MRAGVGPVVVLLAAGCAERSRPLPPGTWWLEGLACVGEIEAGDEAVEVRLWGDRWGTPTEGSPATVGTVPDGTLWLDFPVDTAAGWAEATLALDPAAGRARLPLGYRDGELDLVLALHEGPLDPARREAAGAAHEAALPGLKAAWAEGSFQLRDQAGVLQGQIVLLPGSAAQVQLVSPTALTDGLAHARRRAEGPDQVVLFPVEPQLLDELGLLRLNVPTLRAVLPVDLRPHPDDRWLLASPGAPDPAELAARLAAVRREALAAERALLSALGPRLAAEADEARARTGACPEPATLGPDRQVLLRDYHVAIHALGAGCAVRLAPAVVQHTRRTAVTATAAGVAGIEVLE